MYHHHQLVSKVLANYRRLLEVGGPEAHHSFLQSRQYYRHVVDIYRSKYYE